MKPFVLRLLGFVFLQATLFFVAWRPTMPGQQNTLASTLDKHRHLDAVMAEGRPKIILTGGSNVPFGFQSPLLEQLLGRPVVNMGIAAGLGGPFMLNEIAPAVRARDIVVVALEYDLYESRGHALALRQLLEFRPQSLRFVPGAFQKSLWDESLLSIAGGVLRRSWIASAPSDSFLPADAWYPRSQFNAWGDFTGHYALPHSLADLPAGDPVFHPRIPAAPSEAVIHAVREFATRCSRRGARLCLTWPPIPSEIQERETNRIATLADRLRERLPRESPRVTFLGTPRDFAYPRAAFHDLTYHLNREGAERRTRQIAALLQAELTHPER